MAKPKTAPKAKAEAKTKAAKAEKSPRAKKGALGDTPTVAPGDTQGALKAGLKDQSAPKETAAAKKDRAQKVASESLLGSSKQPALFSDPLGKTVQLGTVVAQAHTKSGLSVADWNSQPEEAREAEIARQVLALGLKDHFVPAEKPKATADAESQVNAKFDEIREILASTQTGVKSPRSLRWAIKSLDMAQETAAKHFTTSA